MFVVQNISHPPTLALGRSMLQPRGSVRREGVMTIIMVPLSHHPSKTHAATSARKRQLCAVVSSNSRQSLPKNWVSNHFILMSTSSSSAAAVVADRPQPSPVKLIERLAKGQGLGQGYGAQGMRRANNEVFGKFRSLARVFLCAPQIRHTIVESICAILCCRN